MKTHRPAPLVVAGTLKRLCAAVGALTVGAIAFAVAPSPAAQAAENSVLHSEVVSVTPGTDVVVGAVLTVETLIENRGTEPTGSGLDVGLSSSIAEWSEDFSNSTAYIPLSVTADVEGVGESKEPSEYHWEPAHFELTRDLVPGERVNVTIDAVVAGTTNADPYDGQYTLSDTGRVAVQIGDADRWWPSEAASCGSMSSLPACFGTFSTVESTSNYTVTLDGTPRDGVLWPGGVVDFEMQVLNTGTVPIPFIEASTSSFDIARIIGSAASSDSTATVWAGDEFGEGYFTFNLKTGRTLAVGDSVTMTFSAEMNDFGEDNVHMSGSPLYMQVSSTGQIHPDLVQTGSPTNISPVQSNCGSVMAGRGVHTPGWARSGPCNVDLTYGLVTLVEPTLEPPTACGVEPEIVIPTAKGVTYIQTREGDTVTVAAALEEGFILAEDAMTTWMFDVSAEECPPEVVEVTPVDPLLLAAEDCSVESEVIIADIDGIIYHEAREGTRVTVIAEAEPGYVIAQDAVSGWTFDVSAEECDAPEPPSPTDPGKPESPSTPRNPSEPAPPSAPAAEKPAPHLASTGSSMTPMLLASAGALLVLAGAALAAARIHRPEARNRG